jgi:hypothetical protein
VRGEPIAALAGLPTAAAIVSVIEPGDRYPGVAGGFAVEPLKGDCGNGRVSDGGAA